MATDSGIVTPPGFNFDPLSSNQKDEWESCFETLELSKAKKLVRKFGQNETKKSFLFLSKSFFSSLSILSSYQKK